jgi:16S rRNA (uracil1498-N3)-methyltransferase
MRTKSLHRFCVEPDQVSRGRVRFSHEQAHQILRVLRMRRGDTMTVFDGTGTEYEAELIALGTGAATALLKGIRAAMPESPLRLVLLQGVPKGEKMEVIVQKATELGVHRIVPLLCERTVARGAGRLPRWRTVAREAAEQCGRAVVPQVDPPVSLGGFLGAQGGARLSGVTLWEDEAGRGLKEALPPMADADYLHVLIGPEGGLAADEVKLALKAGLVPTTLGRRILRTDTAAVAALTIIQYELGDLGRLWKKEGHGGQIALSH